MYWYVYMQSLHENGTLTRSVVNVSFTETPFPINTAPSGVTRLFLQKKKVIKKFTDFMSSSPLCSGLGNLTLSPILLKFDCLSTHHPKL